MKKILFFLTFCFYVGKTMSFAQELVVGGDMEDASKWTFWMDGGAVDSTTTLAVFNYDLDRPKDGSGGCLDVTGYGQTSAFIYQKVQIIPGHKYRLDGLVKNASADSLTNQWVELNLTKVRPTWKAKEDSSWFNYSKNSWMSDPYNKFDNMDGDFFSYSQLLWKKVLPGGKDSVLNSKEFVIPTTEKVTDWYVVIKLGCWNTAGSPSPTFEFLFDNISLVDLGETSVAQVNGENSIRLFPNPSNGIINIRSNNNSIIKYSVYNTVGALIMSGNADKQLNLTSLEKGAYFIKMESNSTIEYHKVILK